MIPENFSNSIALLEHANQKQLYQKLVQQLQKDFTLANIDITIDENLSPEGLKNLIHEKLYRLLLERFSEYLNLLYVVDVPEKAFKDIHMTDVVEVAEQVTFLVLKREFEKVFWKMRYTS
jgi:hypothetical protein